LQNARRILILALPSGLAVGALGWVLFAGGGPASRPLGEIEGRLDRLTIRAAPARAAAPDRGGQIVGAPLFALTTGPGAVAEAAIRLEGLARSRGRAAALVSINGKPSEWLELGATRDGVTLREVMGSKIVVDTATGFKEVTLGAEAPSRGDGPTG